MKTLKSIIVIALISLSVVANAQSKEEKNFLGKWLTEDKTATVEIYKEKNMYYGKVLKSTITKTEKGVPIVGQIVVIEMKLKGKNLEGGTVKDVEENEEYDAKFVPVDANKIKLKISVMLFSHNEIWTRVN
jgi:uncharacterized protein (DUF2147 family)